jgi:iron(III) transport system substrate-binding protein
VLYTSIDEPIARPIIRDFEQQTGIRVTLVTDSEASKTVGLAERLRAEKSNPQADVYWGNEPFHTINLAEEGVLAAYESPSAKNVPERYRDPEHRWSGNALRARVNAEDVIISIQRSATGLQSLIHPRYRDKVAIARPTAGTTGGHVAAIYALWGEQKADEYFRALRANGVKVLGGNSVVAQAVAQRTVRVGLTDNDDVEAARRNGSSLEMTLPDQDEFGTLMIPTTVGLVSGAKHLDGARELVNYLLSAEVERKLIDAKFAGWSVRGTSDVKAMDVDYREVARVMPQAVRRATAILEGREP